MKKRLESSSNEILRQIWRVAFAFAEWVMFALQQPQNSKEFCHVHFDLLSEVILSQIP